jgi:MauM/NapG family ferredoxin protein
MTSGESPASSNLLWRKLRIASQSIFLLSFITLLYITEFAFTSSKNPENTILPPPILKFFFQLDPLTGIATGLSSHPLYSGLALGLIIVIATIFFGRIFCGWICPLGTLNQLCSQKSFDIKGAGRGFLRQFRKSNADSVDDTPGQVTGKLIERNRYHRFQTWKYYLLIGLLAMALLGSLQVGLFDPIMIAARSFGMVIIPALNMSITKMGGWLSDSPIGAISLIGKGIFAFGNGIFIYLKQPHFQGVFWLTMIFAGILLANRFITRFWCRALCPLGALMGLLSRYSIFGLHKNHAACNDCNKCLANCQGADEPQGNVPHRRAECHLCLNCLAACPENVISFRLQGPNRAVYNPRPDLVTRRTVLAGAIGLAAYPIFRSGDQFARESSFIRPPGSLIEEDFLARCVRCGQCMKICPNNALHPATLETGWEGIFTPVLVPRIGYCEHTCVLCGHACPTGAILPLDIKTKIGDADTPPTRIGTAFFDKGRCLPWAMGTTCIVCEEWCPTSPKAIWLEEVEVKDRNGHATMLKLAHVDPDKCTGCGACEKVCPVAGKTGIYITSAGESRDPRKALLLKKDTG